VVLPNADLKIYLDASVEVRAQRRYAEEVTLGNDISLEEVIASLKRRDEIDSTRKVAPLKLAPDAIVINSDNLTIPEVVSKINEIIAQRDP
jgi:cytidylate kinase